jgi:hypothetical protein
LLVVVVFVVCELSLVLSFFCFFFPFALLEFINACREVQATLGGDSEQDCVFGHRYEPGKLYLFIFHFCIFIFIFFRLVCLVFSLTRLGLARIPTFGKKTQQQLESTYVLPSELQFSLFSFEKWMDFAAAAVVVVVVVFLPRESFLIRLARRNWRRRSRTRTRVARRALATATIPTRTKNSTTTTGRRRWVCLFPHFVIRFWV